MPVRPLDPYLPRSSQGLPPTAPRCGGPRAGPACTDTDLEGEAAVLWSPPTDLGYRFRSVPQSLPVHGVQERRLSLNEATFKLQQVRSRKPWELPLSQGMGLLRWHLIIFSHSHSSPRTRFLFLDKPPFADCCEGNTQEELLAVTCFGKH